MESICENNDGTGIWSAPKNVADDDLELAFPKPTVNGYPTPDATISDALQCVCEDLEVKWSVDDGMSWYFYDPNEEEAADFICDTKIDTSLGEFILKSANAYLLHCDNHYSHCQVC